MFTNILFYLNIFYRSKEVNIQLNLKIITIEYLLYKDITTEKM